MNKKNEVKGTEEKENQATQSERFLANVEKQFAAEAGAPMAFTDYEKTLAQHLFLKVDNVLKDLEAKRTGDGLPYNWKSVNMRKLALDAVHRVKLGLDALVPNHIHPIPYYNKREGLYDLDLRVGYVGQSYYRITSAVDVPVDVVYELVYSNDHFKPIKKSMTNKIESYEFEIENPFDRGEIIGGFGYLQFDDENKNQLIIVTETDFKKSKSAAKSKTFWNDHPVEMRYKTLVHRVTEKLEIDPKKINAASYAHVENQGVEEDARREINNNANKDFIDFEETQDVEDVEYKEVDKETGEISRKESELDTKNEPDPQPETQKNEQKADLFNATNRMENANDSGNGLAF